MMRWKEYIVDFNCGAQIIIPPGSRRLKWRITDLSGEIEEQHGETETDPQCWTCEKCNYLFYVPWRVELETEDGEKFEHNFNPCGKHILIDLHHGAFGDSVAWMPAVEAFAEKWSCKTSVCMRQEHICLFRETHPEFSFLTPEEAEKIKASDTYARYKLAVFGYDTSGYFEREDFRRNNLQRHADMILGVDSKGKAPRIDGSAIRQDIPTVCIATRASRHCKEWNNPGGWEAVSSELAARGYRVVCIDADNLNCPKSAEDNTGKIPLVERARLLKGASLFIGLPSGLSWLAWACGVPVVLISGFTDIVRITEDGTQQYPEFDTRYRVRPPNGVCRNCWLDCDQRETARFDECYYGIKNECTRSISAESVLEMCGKALAGG